MTWKDDYLEWSMYVRADCTIDFVASIGRTSRHNFSKQRTIKLKDTYKIYFNRMGIC